MMLIIIGALDVDPFNNLRGLLAPVLRPGPQIFLVLVPLAWAVLREARG